MAQPTRRVLAVDGQCITYTDAGRAMVAKKDIDWDVQHAGCHTSSQHDVKVWLRTVKDF
ncbi:hypothetical protein VTK73DRAFT_3841 [Phialemonium thermophilum]|uniref:Uncharacterized protein n=1 Tax=Phialemonium thermophilum TaxID=223376 RepID=A0ABR3VEL3_9PEZI